MAIALLGLARPTFAQQPVVRWADWASYGTAAVNPTRAAVDAFRAEHRWCQLGRLALSEGVGNGVTLALKHVIRSPRPCVGCRADGMPSGHSMNSVVGFSRHWQLGAAFAWGTQALRGEANRHTVPQRLAGLAIGVGAELTGRLIPCGER